MSIQNATEEFVFNLCRSTFLSLWSYANPRREGRSGELCDVLVICDPHILIISVKNSELDTEADPQVATQRWLRRAVQDSVKQIYGAERNLSRATAVTRADGTEGLQLPPLNERRVHRISVSLGAKGLIPLSSQDFGKGFVHVFDEDFVPIALRHLNTVSDFIEYLEAKESLVGTVSGLETPGGEENLLAIYLWNGRAFPEDDPLEIKGGEWTHVSRSDDYLRKLEAEKQSFGWDRLVDHFAEEMIADRMEFGGTLSENEQVIRAMARESRFARRILTETLVDFWDRALKGEVRARMLVSPSGIGYVFFNPPTSYSREARKDELWARCFIARDSLDGCETVIGLGMNVKPAPKGFAADLLLMSRPEWSDEDRREAEHLRAELGFFKNPLERRASADEYPAAAE